MMLKPAPTVAIRDGRDRVGEISHAVDRHGIAIRPNTIRNHADSGVTEYDSTMPDAA